MASPAFDTSAFDASAFDVTAFDLADIGPTPDVGGGFGRRRTAAFVRKNADFVNRSA